MTKPVCRVFGRWGSSGFAVLVSARLVGACATPPAVRPAGEVTYVGSSTVANFLRDAEPVYGALRFSIDTAPESEGGELAIEQGTADLAGVANRPRAETLRAGVTATLIGRDAIAVIVHEANPVRALSRQELRAVFTGEIRSWDELGGADVPVRPFVVGEESATRKVFRGAVLAGAEYSGAEEVRPDRAIVDAVAGDPGGIGHISLSFLDHTAGIRAVAVDGQEPTSSNLDYPITRPLYLLWRRGSPLLEAFVAWVQGEEGQGVIMRRFVGTGVVGSVQAMAPGTEGLGTLIVRTETDPFLDDVLTYYPHRPYEILARDGQLVRRVANRIGQHDETPTRVELPPGTYLIRTETTRRGPIQFFVVIESGTSTEVDVAELLKRRG
jgi:phosphate transport system substrate-binding protein